MTRNHKLKFKMIFILSLLSSVLSAIVVSYDSLPACVLPSYLRSFMAIVILFSSGLATLLHVLNSNGYVDLNREQNNIKD